jgi:hypothetical protein
MSLKAKEMLKKAKEDIAEEARVSAINKEPNEGIKSLLDKFRTTEKELSEIRDKYDRDAKSVIRESLKIEFFLLKKTISRLTPEQESLMETAHTICINDKYMNYMNNLRSAYHEG